MQMLRDLPKAAEKISGRMSKPTTERCSLKSTLQTTGTRILPTTHVYILYHCILTVHLPKASLQPFHAAQRNPGVEGENHTQTPVNV